MWNYLLDLAEDEKVLTDIADKFVKIMEGIAGPVLVVVGAFAAAYIVYLGVMYAKAEDDGKRKDLQKRLIGMIIGFVLLSIVLTIVLAIDWKEAALGWDNFTLPNSGTGVNNGNQTQSGGVKPGFAPSVKECISAFLRVL